MIPSLFLFLCLFTAMANTAPINLKTFLTIGYGRGGDELATITGGQDFKIASGDGLSLLIGKIFVLSPTAPHRFEVQLGAGYLFQNDEHSQENRVSWTRIPLEAVYYYHNTKKRFRLGWGAVYHVVGRLDGKGANEIIRSNSPNTWGFVVGAEKLWTTGTGEILSIGLRHTSIRYHLSSFDKTINGDAWGVTVSGFLF